MNNWDNYGQYNRNSWDRPSTNIQYCTSLEEALSRCNSPNSENVFFHQDQMVFYRIRVESDGRKYWQAFEYNVPKAAESNLPVSRADLTDIVERLQRIENYVFQEVEVNPNEKPDG